MGDKVNHEALIHSTMDEVQNILRDNLLKEDKKYDNRAAYKLQSVLAV